jgi:hypothetical protein
MIREPLKRKKKGQIIQVAFFMVFVFIIILTLLISKLILNKFNDALNEGNLHTPESQEALNQMGTAFPTFDNAILMVLIILTIGLIITSFLIPSHPIFLVINIFGIFFLCFLGFVLSNLYKEIIDNSEDLAEVYTTFPKLTFVMNKIPWIAAILVFIVTIVGFARYQGGGYG